MTSSTIPTETDNTTSQVPFETALGELQQIVSILENGAASLDDSMQQFERGVGLLKSCYRVLENAEQRIEILTGVNREGVPQTQAFDASATFESAADEPAPARKPRARKSSGDLPF